jgi:NADH-quinone oxidoreductase subunit H
VKGEVEIDFLPRGLRRPIQEARAREAKRASEFLGLELAPSVAGQTAVVIGSVRPGSPAARAELASGDTLASFDGVSVLELEDLVPGNVEPRVTAVVLRDGKRIEKSVEVAGFDGDRGRELLGAIVVLGTLLLVLLLLGTRVGAVFTWLLFRVERAIGLGSTTHGSGRPTSLVTAFARLVRGVDTESVPGTLARIAPALVAIGVSATFAVIPIVELRTGTELDLGMLYLLPLTSFVAMGLVTGGWSHGPAGLFGRVRASLRVVTTEAPAAVALAAIVVMTGSLRVRDVALAQIGAQGDLLETGGWPWYWHAARSPQLFVLFCAFFAVVLVDGSFDVGAKRKTREGSAGVSLHAESAAASRGSSLRRAAFFFVAWTNVFVMCSLGAITFLGGWYVPGFSAHEHRHSTPLLVAGTALFLVKCWVLALVVIAARSSLPRISADLVVRFYAKWILPVLVVSIGLTGLAVRFPLLPTAERAIGLVTMATVATLCLIGVLSLRSALRSTGRDHRHRTRVNPLL